MHEEAILKHGSVFNRGLFFKWTILTAILLTSVLAVRAQDTRTPNAGSLRAFDREGKQAGECPLKHTSVKAEVSGFLSRVTVTQDFENPFTDKIEAFYTFPLPQAAAVDDLTMIIGDRTVKGKIMRREEAQASYAAAKQLGKVAALLDQQRPNIFTQSVANIMPGQQIRIVISYVETLKYEDGSYEWSFPMVVAPRYGSVTTDDTNSNSYSMRAGHDISLDIAIDAGVPLASLSSETHETEVERSTASRALVRLKDLKTIPNKDFILKYQVAGPAINDAVLAHRSERGGFFTLILQPPQRVSAEDVMPKELVFVVDTSGSMSGFPIEKAKETASLALDNLYPHDTFNLITFSGDTRILFSEPVPATPDNLDKAKKFLSAHNGDGGTEMMKAIKASLKPSDSQHHVRIVCFMTDGHVGNDMQIIAEVKKYKNARVFAMGFGGSPNRYLLDNMAEYGRGEVDYIPDGGDSSAVAKRFHDRVRNPLLTDISIEWSPTLPVTDIYPKRVPDLFSAKPLILSGRYVHGGNGTIVLKGKMAGEDFVRVTPVALPEAQNEHDVLATLWARRKVDDLMSNEMASLQSKEKSEEITQLGLKFKLMTQYTSFLAVDEVIFTGIEQPRPANVPLHVPAGTIPSGILETVTVSGEAALSSAEVSIGNMVTICTLRDLPLQGRSLTSLATLVPGVVQGNSNQVTVPPQVSLPTNGQRANANMFTVDGVSANFGITPGGHSPGSSAAGSTPALTASGGANGIVSMGAAEEMVIKTSYTEAEYGRVPGAQVNIVTRVGANNFHGSVFHFFGNDALDANDWFANSRGLQKPARRLNNFGGTLGGPIRRDQTFFFVSYEGLRLRKPMTGITDVPSLFSRATADPEVRPFLNAFPVPTGAARPDGFAEFAATFANAARHDVGSIRIDEMHDAWSFNGKYSFADSVADERGAGGFSLNTTNRIRSRAQTISGSLNRILSTSKIVELRANYSRLRVTGSHVLDEFGGAVVPSDLIPPAGESFNFDLNARGASLMAGSEVSNIQRQLNLTGAISIVSGDHSYKFGVDYRRMSPAFGARAIETNTLFNGVNQALTGIPSRLSLFNREGSPSPDFNNLSLYAQDEWRTTPRLTLTYGLRWELNPPPSTDGTQPIAVDQVNDPSQLKSAAPGVSLWQTTFLNFAPRLGATYKLSDTNNRELILRGGVGIFYDLGHERAGDVFVDSVPFVSGSAAPAIVFDPQLKLPYTLTWNVSLERELGSKQSLIATYVGAAGRRLLHTETLFDRNPAFPFLRLTTNEGRSDYRALQVQFNRRLSEKLGWTVSYSWARSLDNVSEDSARNVLMTSANPALDRGPSDFDVHHQLTGFVNYEIPALFSTGIGNKFFRNWVASSIFNTRSAKPVNVVYMFPTSYGVAYLRPDAVAGQPLYIVDSTTPGGRSLNPAAFMAPAGLEQGNLGRNSLRGFPFYQIDLALRRRFNFSESLSLHFQADAFNLFNHPNFEDPFGRDRVVASTFDGATFTPNLTFGQSSSLAGQSLAGNGSAFGSFYSTGGPRVLRFSLKLVF